MGLMERWTSCMIWCFALLVFDLFNNGRFLNKFNDYILRILDLFCFMFLFSRSFVKIHLCFFTTITHLFHIVVHTFLLPSYSITQFVLYWWQSFSWLLLMLLLLLFFFFFFICWSLLLSFLLLFCCCFVVVVLLRPDVTVMVDWALKINYQSIFFFFFLCFFFFLPKQSTTQHGFTGDYLIAHRGVVQRTAMQSCRGIRLRAMNIACNPSFGHLFGVTQWSDLLWTSCIDTTQTLA